MKVANNPYARGFREDGGKTRNMLKLQPSRQQTNQNSTAFKVPCKVKNMAVFNSMHTFPSEVCHLLQSTESSAEPYKLFSEHHHKQNMYNHYVQPVDDAVVPCSDELTVMSTQHEDVDQFFHFLGVDTDPVVPNLQGWSPKSPRKDLLPSNDEFDSDFSSDFFYHPELPVLDADDVMEHLCLEGDITSSSEDLMEGEFYTNDSSIVPEMEVEEETYTDDIIDVLEQHSNEKVQKFNQTPADSNTGFCPEILFDSNFFLINS